MRIQTGNRLGWPKKWAMAAVFILAAVLAPVAAACGSGAGPGGGQANTPAIDFTLAGIDGRDLSLSDLKGKVVLINFWTTWCPACKDEMPLLQAAYQEKRASGLVILGVDLKEDGATVEKFLNDNGLTFPVVLDTKGDVSSEYNVYYIPHSVIVDREGKVRRVKVGAFYSTQEILDIVEPFLSSTTS